MHVVNESHLLAHLQPRRSQKVKSVPVVDRPALRTGAIKATSKNSEITPDIIFHRGEKERDSARIARMHLKTLSEQTFERAHSTGLVYPILALWTFLLDTIGRPSSLRSLRDLYYGDLTGRRCIANAESLAESLAKRVHLKLERTPRIESGHESVADSPRVEADEPRIADVPRIETDAP